VFPQFLPAKIRRRNTALFTPEMGVQLAAT